jgi:outer membrane receptor protein involved in Fe transport
MPLLSRFANARYLLPVGGLLCWALGSPTALAADAQETGLEEIVVTAQKFESTVQSTPISITALSGD